MAIPERDKRTANRVFVISKTTPSEGEAKRHARKLVSSGLAGAQVYLTRASGYLVAFGPFSEAASRKFRADAISRGIIPDDAYYLRNPTFRKKIPYEDVVERRFLHVVAYGSLGQARAKVDFFLGNGLKAEVYLNTSNTHSVVINAASRREALQVKRAAESNGLIEADAYLVDRGELGILVYPTEVPGGR